MDIVGLTLLVTFLSLMMASAFAVFVFPFRWLPLERRELQCPESGNDAQVGLTWNIQAQDVTVATCNDPRFACGACNRACLNNLRGTFPSKVSTTVIG
jgi:hypothetical protein